MPETCPKGSKTVEIYKGDNQQSCSLTDVSYTDYEEPKSVQTDPPFIIPTNNKKRISDDIKDALACNRTGVSDRSAAIIASAGLRDIGIISEEDSSFIVERSKILRARTPGTFHRTTARFCFIRGDIVGNNPCHTQAVERCIKLVTEASQAVCGDDVRDGFIGVRLK
ncbi:hypothetical protein ILUMI_02675 [Ignelater luminosus]|uniref:Uncharacterized protein n=1 Tax=Ignelater luminosus TaxID=2038154 RepID=A0A8K0GMY8_IGNLU|nr:hypothetical protein ILUMI_02675 [Ignelater luminosus]